jgi:hypothetical protein
LEWPAEGIGYAFDIQALYSKTHNQVTFWATITLSTPAALAAIIAARETPELATLFDPHSPKVQAAQQTCRKYSNAAGRLLPPG